MNYFNVNFNNLNNHSDDIKQICESFNNIQTELNSMLELLNSSLSLVSNDNISIQIAYTKNVNNINEFYDFIYSSSSNYFRLLFNFNNKQISYRIQYHDFIFSDNIILTFKENQLFNQSLEKLNSYIDLEKINEKLILLQNFGVKIYHLEKRFNEQDIRQQAKVIQEYFVKFSFQGITEFEKYSNDDYININLMIYIEGKEILFRRANDAKYYFIPLKTPTHDSIIKNDYDCDYIKNKIIELNPDFFNLIQPNIFSVNYYNYFESKNMQIIEFEFKGSLILPLYEKINAMVNLSNF